MAVPNCTVETNPASKFNLRPSQQAAVARMYATTSRLMPEVRKELLRKEREERKERRFLEATQYFLVAAVKGLQPKDVKSAVEGIFTLAVEQMKKSGKFNLAGMFILKLKARPATMTRKGVNPLTKEPCVFKGKPASKTIKVRPLKKLSKLVC